MKTDYRTDSSPGTSPRRRWHARSLRVATATAAGLCLAVAGPLVAAASPASAASHGLLDVGHAGRYGAVLTNAAGDSLYTLDNSQGKQVCTGRCLGFWPPVVVSRSTTHVDLGPGVTGQVGFMPLNSKSKLVTFDGYPLYTFIKDTKAGQANGEGVVAFGGTWELLRPSALVAAPAASAAAAAAPKTTTTKAYGSGY